VISARPSLVLVAGVNGSGKSTFAADAKGTDLLLGQATINPDDLGKDAAKEFPTLNQSGADLAGAERAEKAVWRAIAEGNSVAVETVLSSKKFAPVLVAARRRRFKTRLIFIALPTVEQSLARIAARVKSGGHDVPEEKVRQRWQAAHDNLVLFAPLVDDLIVFSNAGTTPVVVAERAGRAQKVRLLEPGALPEITRRFAGDLASR